MIGKKCAKGALRNGLKVPIGKLLNTWDVAAGDLFSKVVKCPQITRQRFIRLSEDFLDFRFIAHLGAFARPYEGAASSKKEDQTAALCDPILSSDQDHS
ncbi:MAG: hypothetical protein BGP16_14600 [Sphingobium sp. 66-54]|nr:MAG: hypothetical protein BGP16_14600 [Sphingobium sp. 66-54]